MSDYADNLLALILVEAREVANTVAPPGEERTWSRQHAHARHLLEALDAWDRLGPVKVEAREDKMTAPRIEEVDVFGLHFFTSIRAVRSAHVTAQVRGHGIPGHRPLLGTLTMTHDEWERFANEATANRIAISRNVGNGPA